LARWSDGCSFDRRTSWRIFPAKFLDGDRQGSAPWRCCCCALSRTCGCAAADPDRGAKIWRRFIDFAIHITVDRAKGFDPHFGVNQEHPWFWSLIGVDQAASPRGLSIFMAAN
jgi:hypothetical protein